MAFFTINELAQKEMAAGLNLRSVHLHKLMLTFVDFEPGVDLPKHSHPHEQITLVIEGTIAFTLDEETKILTAGQGVTVPSNVPHSARSLAEPSRVVDAWHPLREDYKMG